MAYSVISQNNTTTTLADELGNVIHVPARVNLATSTNYTITKVNNNTATLEDENGNVIRDVPCVAVLYGGGGGGDSHNLGWYATQSALETAHPTAEDGDYAIVGSTDTVWVWDSDTTAWVDTDTKGEVTPDMIIVKSATMPTASTVPAGAVYQYTGTTSASYTHGYIYENKETTTYTDSVEFNPASISGTTVAATTGALASLCEEYGSGDITDIIKGTLTYDLAGGLLVFVGLDDTDTQVCTFQLYTQDYEDAGFTFTGTLADGDVINFTCTISEVVSYAWERIDVQPAPVVPDPLPSQTGNSGKFLTTDGTDASWASISFPVSSVNNKTGAVTLTASDVGALPDSTVIPAAQVNSDWNSSSGVSEILNKPSLATVATTGAYSDLSGTPTIPSTAADVNAIPQLSTLPTADATNVGQLVQFSGATGTYTNGYFYTSTYDSGTSTYSWVQTDIQPASGSPLPSQTGNSGKFLTTDGTDPSWATVDTLPSQTGQSGKYLMTNGTSAFWGVISGALQNTAQYASSHQSLTILGTANNSTSAINIGYNSVASDSYTVSLGNNAEAKNSTAIAIGCYAQATGQVAIRIGYAGGASGTRSIAIGAGSTASGNYAIQLGGGTNADACTLKVGWYYNSTNVNYELLSSDGTIPADRFASTTGLADGNYRLRLTMASGVPTLSWVAE